MWGKIGGGQILVGAKLGGGPPGFPASPLTRYQPAYKPGFVRHMTRIICVTTIPLARRLPGASSNLPERQIRTDPGLLPRRSYSVLLPVGFAVPPASPQARCALTAPFHPYLPFPAGGSFSVALSLRPDPACAGSRPAGRYPAPFVPGARTFLSGRLSALARSGRPAD